MKSNGVFYYNPSSSSKTTIQDRLAFTIADKYGKKSTARVTISFIKASVSTGTVINIQQNGKTTTDISKVKLLDIRIKVYMKKS
jgi:archaellum component FlaF (FlaF/FlaG flagellin family)